ncbi:MULTISPECIES: efflux RND transporter periplasmic adaptor subunit [Rhodomicrobium]|uniref:efflux RND transporter periplasmic adaptor subunit n=1 Tax=Rhodomicrobium TaxID=1068 RepID=UPI000B4B1483|nr:MULTISPECIES: efflux RND transporter periplasmic adaptor subunit [Rhodomicrobium]
MTLQRIQNSLRGGRLPIAATALGLALVFASPAPSASAAEAAAPPAAPVSVARVEQRDAMIWNEFSGRLEAIERVEIRSRVAGAIQQVHFREGALVKANDLLITIDPAPFQAEVDRLKAQVTAAEARVALTKTDLERARQLANSPALSQRDTDQRLNAAREADANLLSARAALQAAQLNLDYTQVRAPVAGRVGKLEITVGNLIAAGPGTPLLVTLMSVNPVYASFNADEGIVTRALKELPSTAVAQMQVEAIPVRLATDEGAELQGKLQLIDNHVDAASGTVRMRAVFDNQDGRLIPGQFVRISMGEAKAKPALLVNERAVGTDQDKKYVLVVDQANKTAYRKVTLGPVSNGLRVVTDGLQAGERIVVNGLQRIRPGAVVEPQMVSMDGSPLAQASAENKAASSVAQR